MVWYFNEHCCCCSSGLCTRKFFLSIHCLLLLCRCCCFFCAGPTGWQMTVALSLFLFCCYFFDGTFTNSGGKKILHDDGDGDVDDICSNRRLLGCCQRRTMLPMEKKIVNEPSGSILLFVSVFLDLLTLALMSDWRPIAHCIGVKQKEIVPETIEFNAAV